MYGPDLAFIHHSAFGDLAKGAAPAIIDRLKQCGHRDGLVIDLACGSGLLAAELVSAGFDVLGVDLSPDMIELARQVCPGGQFVVGSVHQTELPPCVAVVSVGEGLTYLSDPAEELRLDVLFGRIATALEPGGFLIFDAVECARDEAMNYTAQRSGDDWHLSVRVTEDTERRLLTREIDIVRGSGAERSRSREVHYVRTLDPNETKDLLTALGFDVTLSRAYGDMPLAPRRFACIAQKA
ncbi:MAG TPA: class I SAM-dependent methyltransferase [Gemmatimonadaceae bacterium]